MMKKPVLTLAALTVVVSLSGCGGMNLFGGGKANQIPVSRAAPLVVPPDFPLMPAKSTAVRTADGASQDQVLDALFGGAAPRSAGERALLSAAGTSELAIRSTVGDPDTVTVNKGSVTRDIISAPEGDGQNAQAAIPQ